VNNESGTAEQCGTAQTRRVDHSFERDLLVELGLGTIRFNDAIQIHVVAVIEIDGRLCRGGVLAGD